MDKDEGRADEHEAAFVIADEGVSEKEEEFSRKFADSSEVQLYTAVAPIIVLRFH